MSLEFGYLTEVGMWSLGVSERGSMDLGDWGSSISDWTSSISDWTSVVDLGDNWGSVDGFGDSWGRSVDDSVESVDVISGVGDSSDGTVRLNKGVLSLDGISVSGFLVSLRISGKSVLDGVSVGVLWVVVEVLGNSDGS
jgi:hypothetical protein